MVTTLLRINQGRLKSIDLDLDLVLMVIPEGPGTGLKYARYYLRDARLWANF